MYLASIAAPIAELNSDSASLPCRRSYACLQIDERSSPVMFPKSMSPPALVAYKRLVADYGKPYTSEARHGCPRNLSTVLSQPLSNAVIVGHVQ